MPAAFTTVPEADLVREVVGVVNDYCHEILAGHPPVNSLRDLVAVLQDTGQSREEALEFILSVATGVSLND